jgi:hypothetical protein
MQVTLTAAALASSMSCSIFSMSLCKRRFSAVIAFWSFSCAKRGERDEWS